MAPIKRLKTSEFMFRCKKTGDLYRGSAGKGTYTKRSGAEKALNYERDIYGTKVEDYEIVEFKLVEVKTKPREQLERENDDEII